MTGSRDVAVVGAGVIGLAIAWRCAQRGLDVAVIDPRPGSGASSTAGGMLAPVTELHYEGRPQLALNLDSAARYPDFAAELAELTGVDIGYRTCGTLQAAWDAADLAGLRDLHRFQRTLGVTSELLTGRQLRVAEPNLAAGLPGGLWARDDHRVDNRLLHGALLRATELAGVTMVAAPVTGWLRDGDRVTGVRTGTADTVTAATTVLAAGAWSRLVAAAPAGALPPEAQPQVRPVKGQTLRLRGPAGLLERVVRGTVRGRHVYVVPRDDGHLVVGASAEEAGFDLTPRTGAVYELLRDVQELLPCLGELEFVDVSTSLRPGSPDNSPLIGPGALDGLVLATGHYRNGILLTPVTGDTVAAIIAGEGTDPILACCDPYRFATAEVES